MSNARIEQALEGVALPMDEPIQCADCGVRLSDGAPITVAAVRNSEVWRVRHVWGATCAPTSLEEFGATDVIAEADLGSAVDTAAQRHYPIPLSVAVIDVREESDPHRGRYDDCSRSGPLDLDGEPAILHEKGCPQEVETSQ